MPSSTHRISIPTILNVGKNNLSDIGKTLAKQNLKNVAFFVDSFIYDMYGKSLESSIKSDGISNFNLYQYDDINIENILKIAFSISGDTSVIIGMGGGKVLDCAKYIGFLRNIPFISVPTSASNDGFASSTCSLLVDGKRTTVSAKVPYGVIVDIDIIKSAPDKFVLSGVGDLISKITAIYDWQFEASKGVASIDDIAVLIAKKSVNSFVRTHFNSIKDDFFLKELIDSLVMNGIASEIAESSAPVSGSEHLISHALDKILEVPQLHGVQVGIATYIMANVQNHRIDRIAKVLSSTGFFEYAKTLEMRKTDFINAVDQAPSIKPNRYTYIHEERFREKAKEFIESDKIVNDILR